ncbi:hypothetical protein [Leptotrichia trevisanii]|uniref:hypothetical protein n=1 Tax=Leptotrichia trevisanii TaxID=109328 RepID=UPI00047A9D35|nr:hypothetical protein [Leptotrichia trevisanii]
MIILKEKGFKDIEVVTVVVSRLKKSDNTMMFGKNTICIVDLLDSLSFLFSQGVNTPCFRIFVLSNSKCKFN